MKDDIVASTDLDLLRVTADHVVELQATSVDAHVVVAGDRYFSGNAAMTKAREVAQFVAAVRATGIEELDVHLESVVVRTTKGLLTTSSGASYELRVHCGKIDSLADVIGAAAALKEARLTHLEWRYDDGPDVRAAWLEAAAKNARTKADRAAVGLGVRVVGVHRFSEQLSDLEGREAMHQQTAFSSRSRGKSIDIAADLGMSISHTKRVTLRVDAQFRVVVA